MKTPARPIISRIYKLTARDKHRCIMFKFQYSREMIEVDGVLRRRISEGYFANLEVLRAYLKQWSGASGPNGGTYQYFETADNSGPMMQWRGCDRCPAIIIIPNGPCCITPIMPTPTQWWIMDRRGTDIIVMIVSQ